MAAKTTRSTALPVANSGNSRALSEAPSRSERATSRKPTQGRRPRRRRRRKSTASRPSPSAATAAVRTKEKARMSSRLAAAVTGGRGIHRITLARGEAPPLRQNASLSGVCHAASAETNRMRCRTRVSCIAGASVVKAGFVSSHQRRCDIMNSVRRSKLHPGVTQQMDLVGWRFERCVMARDRHREGHGDRTGDALMIPLPKPDSVDFRHTLGCAPSRSAISWTGSSPGSRERPAFCRSGASHGEAKRLVPSAGARYPLELTLVVRRVEALQPGLYDTLRIGTRSMRWR